MRPFEVTAKQNLDEADRLGLEAGDVVIVSDGRPQNFWWHGQNRRTGEIGSFPRGIVQRDSKLSCGFFVLHEQTIRRSINTRPFH